MSWKIWFGHHAPWKLRGANVEKFQFSFRFSHLVLPRTLFDFKCKKSSYMITMSWSFNWQLYISRGSIDSFSLVSDAAYISASLARIMRALFEICLRRGWCEMSSFMLDYCKAVDRQIWPHQHPLRQFDKDISLEVCLFFYYFMKFLKLFVCVNPYST